MDTLKEKVKKFLDLPRLFNTPQRRLRREISDLKDIIEIVPCEDGYVDSNSGCCGKDTYHSYESAMGAIVAYHNKQKKPHRAYKCCAGNWHLTSMTLKQFNNK